jgi:hypothetical protein
MALMESHESAPFFTSQATLSHYYAESVNTTLCSFLLG